MDIKKKTELTARQRFLGFSLESTRKSYYPQLMAQLETVRENERRLRLLTDSLPARISYVDADQCFRFVNRAYEIALGCKRKNIIGRKIRDMVGAHNYALIEKYIATALSGAPARFEACFRDKNGRARWLEVYYAPYLDDQRRVMGFYDLTHDVTDRKQAEEALRASEKQYRLLVDNANDAIFIAQDGVIKFPNPQTLRLLGLDGPQTMDIPFADYIHPQDRSMVIDMHVKRLKGVENMPPTYTFRVVNARGQEYAVELNAIKISWEDRPATLNFIRDVTVQKKLEENLLHDQKMKAIGNLAGGIAHDFNNILMGIQGRVSIMLTETDTCRAHHDHLRAIAAYVSNATDLTRQLLGFARGGKYELKPTDLNRLVKQNADLFGRTHKEITIVPCYDDALWAVEVDRGQIGQVLLNLFVNAAQAMPAGGALYLTTQNTRVDDQGPLSPDLKPGNYVKLNVTDTGVGMDAATRERVFDPFFTTKSMGRGTGLGLASAYGIVKNHEGAIRVYSEPGHGSTFTIYLPATSKPIAPEPPVIDRTETGSERILLIDDEEMILDVGRQMLEKLGYSVLTARSGREAMKRFVEPRVPIDLVILDMIMPGQGGGEVFDQIKALIPDINVLLSSGYSMTGKADQILKRGCRGFIQKPFSLTELSAKIREILDQPFLKKR